MSFSGFAPINTPKRLRETGGRPPPDISEMERSPSTRKSTYQERRIAQANIIPNYLQLRENYETEEALDVLLDQQKSVEAKCSIAIQILDTAQGITEEMSGVEEAMWERVIEKHQLWGPLGGKERVKEMMEYESQAGVRIAKQQGEGRRKTRARETLANLWGEGWEEKVDPQQRLWKASEHALQNLVARAREGWRMEVIERSLNNAFRARMLDRRRGVTMRPVYTKGDTEDGTALLRRAEAESGKKREDVTLEDLEPALPGAPSKRRVVEPTQGDPHPPSPQPTQEELHTSSSRTAEGPAHTPPPRQMTPSSILSSSTASSSSSSSTSPHTAILGDPSAHMGLTVAWDFDRRCFFYAQPNEPIGVSVEGAIALIKQGYTVEQFGLESPTKALAEAEGLELPESEHSSEPSQNIPPPGPIRRRRRVRTPLDELRRSAKVRGQPNESPAEGSLFPPTSS